MDFVIKVADIDDLGSISDIMKEIEMSAKEKGVAIAERSYEYLKEKIMENKAVMAYCNEEWAGFCYIETWSNREYISHSGLIVKKKFRKEGLAKMIKEKIFHYSLECYPTAKIFGLTTSLAVMKINSGLGYVPTIYSELTQDEEFWKGCQGCKHYEILQSREGKNCLCTGMLFDPANHINN